MTIVILIRIRFQNVYEDVKGIKELPIMLKKRVLNIVYKSCIMQNSNFKIIRNKTVPFFQFKISINFTLFC